MRGFRVFWRVFQVALLGLALAACDAVPGPTDSERRPPVLADLTFTPASVQFESHDDALKSDTTITIPLTLQVTATDPDGGSVDTVLFVVRSPLQTFEPVVIGGLGPASGAENRYELPEGTALLLDKGAVGTYEVVVFAVDDEELLSEEVRATLRYTAAGTAPEIRSVEVPEGPIRRPAEGAQPVAVPLVVEVSDADGLRNVARVQYWDVARPNLKFSLFDDGGQSLSGDDEAGDGFYTQFFVLTDEAAPGTRTLAFQATDRSGLESEVATVDLPIQ